MRKLFIFFATVLFLVGCTNVDSTTTPDTTSYQTIDISKVEEKIADQWQVVDVREVEEFNEGHIRNAINQPLSLIQQGDFGTLTKDNKYIIICRSGNRSQQASELLTESGFKVINVQQGMSSWKGEIE